MVEDILYYISLHPYIRSYVTVTALHEIRFMVFQQYFSYIVAVGWWRKP